MEDKKDIEINTEDLGLREIAPGFIRFSIKAEDTLENMQIHSAFKEFCRVETDNNYTLGLKKLIETFEGDFKMELLYEKINNLDVAVNELRESVAEAKKKPEGEDSTSF